MTLRKITDQDMRGYGVIGMEDTPNLSARQMQEKVEEVVRKVVIPVINENVDSTVSIQNLADVVLKAGAGDMLTLNYDTNMDGIVNKADNGFFTYSHSKSGNVHYLEGSGDNIKFAATRDFYEGDVFVLNGKTCTAFMINGDPLSDEYFKAGYVVSCFKNGNSLNFSGGGAVLNFKVVGGTTQPASPKENTIWVNTDLPITAWALDATQPDYLPFGGVWIEIATLGNTLFNALKKNYLFVAPKRAWQWVGDRFEEYNVLTYINGQWVKAEEILFPHGIEFTTGGENVDKCEAAATYLHCEALSTFTNGNCHSVKIIDCSRYTKLIFEVESVALSGNGTATVGVHYSGAGSVASAYTARLPVTAPGTYEVDLTNVDHGLYVTISVWASDGTAEMTVTGIIAI